MMVAQFLRPEKCRCTWNHIFFSLFWLPIHWEHGDILSFTLRYTASMGRFDLSGSLQKKCTSFHVIFKKQNNQVYLLLLTLWLRQTTMIAASWSFPLEIALLDWNKWLMLLRRRLLQLSSTDVVFTINNLHLHWKLEGDKINRPSWPITVLAVSMWYLRSHLSLNM